MGLDTMLTYRMGFSDKYENDHDSGKGKYLRPIFCQTMCAGLGGKPEQAIPVVAALGLIHRTSLIFDDIQDKGKERNNQPTVCATWDVDQAINAGLALPSYARLAIHGLTLRNVPDGTILEIQNVLENAVIALCWGQFMDISSMEVLNVAKVVLWRYSGEGLRSLLNSFHRQPTSEQS